MTVNEGVDNSAFTFHNTPATNRIFGATGTFAKSYTVGGRNKRTNNRTMLPPLKDNAAAGYNGQVKRELLKGADLMVSFHFQVRLKVTRSAENHSYFVSRKPWANLPKN